MENTRCYICGCEKNSFLFTKGSNRFYRCETCDVVFIWPQQKAEEISNMYQTWGEKYYLDPQKIASDYSASFEERLSQLEPYRKNNRLLDVGCSLGAFLSAARDRKWECFGVELSRPSALYAKNEKKLNVFNGTFAAARYEKDYFDVVNIWAVLEHVPDPVSLVVESFRVLRPGGLLVVSVPNFNCLPIKVIGKKYRYICGGHLFYFSRKTLNILMKRVGFRDSTIFSDYVSPLSFLEDIRGVQPDTMKTHKQERENVQAVKKNKTAYVLLRPVWRMFMFIVRRCNLGEVIGVMAVK